MNRSLPKKNSLLQHLKVPEKKSMMVFFKESNKRLHTEPYQDQFVIKDKILFSDKSKSRSIKKSGTNDIKERKSMDLRIDTSTSAIKKTFKKEIDYQKKMFRKSIGRPIETSKFARLKTEPQESQMTEICKKLGDFSVVTQKLQKEIPQQSKVSKQGNYKIERIVGKGTFGTVYQAIHIKTHEKVAIKTVLQDKKYKNRELEILRMLHHPNVLAIKEHFYTSNKSGQYLNVVMPYFQDTIHSINRKYLINNKTFPPVLVKVYAYQLFRGLNYLTSLNIAHRDIKPHNILVNSKNKVIICDFGSAKQLIKGKSNIAYICSRCYRAPQLIFGCTQYSTQIDMWSLGCVIIEMINGDPPFIGDSQTDLLVNIIKILGTPDQQTILEMNPEEEFEEVLPVTKGKEWKKVLKSKTDPLLIDLIDKIIKYSPSRRLTPFQALCHPYFDQIRDEERYKLICDAYGYQQFFNFEKEQIRSNKNFLQKLFPYWAQKFMNL